MGGIRRKMKEKTDDVAGTAIAFFFIGIAAVMAIGGAVIVMKQVGGILLGLIIVAVVAAIFVCKR